MKSSKPNQCSAFYHVLEKHAAGWTEVNGWQCAEKFEKPEAEKKQIFEAMGICDISHFFKLEFAGKEVKEFLAELGYTVPPPAGHSTKDSVILCSSSAQTYLLLSETTIPRPSAPQGACIHMTDRTAGLAGLLLAGPKSLDLLSSLVPIDTSPTGFPNGRSALCSFARVPAILIRKDGAEVPAYRVFFSREYGDYVWHAMEEAQAFCPWALFGETTRHLLEDGHA